ncbi:MAG: hypothetical protein ACM3H8_00855 [Sphingobacteriales bacterium]
MPARVIPQKSTESKKVVEEECAFVVVKVPASLQRTNVLEYAMKQKGHLGNTIRRRPVKKLMLFLSRGKWYLLYFTQCLLSHSITESKEFCL